MMSPEKYEDQPKTSVTTNVLTSNKPNLKGDWSNLFLLILLYIMQGLPLGLSDAIPVLLQTNKNVTYKDQALFSIVKWPYTLKIIWAPLVDSLYVHRLGRRKSWLVPVQFLMGMCFIYMAHNFDDWFPETGNPNILKLLCVCFTAKLLAATQDIVVDGWALTMLKKNNVGYSSTCGSTGTIIGIMIGSVFPVLLTSEDFCNKHFRSTPDKGGLITMRSMLNVWGIIFMLLTTLIAWFKREKDCTMEDDHVKLSIFQNYLLLWDILKLRSIRTLAIALLTVKIGFAVVEHVSILKLIDVGVTKDDIMVIQTALFVIKICLPLVVAKYTSGPKSMSIYLNIIPIRLFWSVAFVLLIYYTPTLKTFNNNSIYYYSILGLVLFVDGILASVTTTSLSSYFSRISDPRFGGTYMTLLNTLANFGPAWLSSLALGLIDILTFKKCSYDNGNNCSTQDLKNMCKENGGECVVLVNGYYVEMVLCTIVGFVWYFIFRHIINNLQSMSPSNWLVNVKQSMDDNDTNSMPMT